jgi:diguanylate cyclase (GGDEF)-like protein/PAS domain S-box-containing protein
MRLLFRLTPTLLALVSAVLILGYAGYGLVRERAETITRAELQTQNFARVLEEQARQTLHRVGANLAQADLALAPLRQSASLDLVQARQLLNQLLPADRLIQSVMLLDGRGALVLSTQTEAATGYGASAKSDYFVPHVRGADRELVFGSPVKASDGQWLMPVSRRLGRLGTPLNGVLVAMVRCAYFQSFYDSIERGPDGFLTLFLSSGAAVITSPPADAVIGRNWADSPLFQEHLPAWPTGTVRQVVVKDGIERIYSFRALNDYPVVVTYGLALDTILGAWHHNVWSQGLLITTALLLLAGAVIALRRQETLRQATLEELKNSESHLRESEERFRTLIERSPEATLVHRLGTILYANPAAVNLFGAASAQQLKGKTTPELIHPDSREAQAQRMKRIAEGARMLDMVELKFVRFDARVIEVKIQGISIIFDGAPAILVTMLDITGQKQAEEALRIAATAFESQQGMTITDAHRVILRVNKAFTAITGYSAEEAVGQTPRILKSGRHDSAFYAAMTNSLETEGVWQGEIWNRRKNGEIYPEWLTLSAVKDQAGRATHYVASFNDVSERVHAQAQINTLAFYDPLTQLPNRRLLLDRLQQTLHVSTRHARKNALLFVDLDNFKTLNDTQGHFQGDALLVQVAQRLKTCIREGDTVARLGSDEFVVMLEDLSENSVEAATQAEAVADKVLGAFVTDFMLGGGAYHGTPSIGITLFGGQTLEGSDQPLKRAELAMFQAKSAGRNTLRFFDTQMQAEVSALAALEADLRDALVKQQFLLHYQPQVVGAGRITGVEALVRWQHPQRGMVSPAEFIPLAEANGLILQVGQWVLETACAQLAAWETQPKLAHLTVAVNVSARQFKQSNFVDSVLTTLAATRANPRRLKLELTESMLVDDVESIIAKMGTLRAHGVNFSLDDFGTGYSSLAYLKRLPLDQLKIDQGFVRNIVTDPNDAAIAKMVVVLAESLGLSVIAEGVELQAQADFLAHLGCHAYQGYWFSRPLPLAALEAFAHRNC